MYQRKTNRPPFVQSFPAPLFMTLFSTMRKFQSGRSRMRTGLVANPQLSPKQVPELYALTALLTLPTA